VADGNDPQQFVISRVFDAPREMVWKAFTDADQLKEWWGPEGFTVIAASLDFQPGGRFHYGMHSSNGTRIWGLFRYREIVPPERIVFINSFSDESGGVSRHPGHELWPLEMMTTFTFEQLPDGRTRFTTRWQPLNASEPERRTFADNHDSMRRGWTGTLDKLTQFLAQSA
jgi:uncharacterized protein YndB with AHSA1/START domain